MARYFLSYFDDTLNGIYSHRSSDLINRRPVIMSFLLQKPRRTNGRKGTATKLGQRFIGKLDQLGIK